MKKGLLYIFVLVVMVLLSACGESQAVEVTSTPTSTVLQELPEPEANSTEEFVFSTDWHVCATIEEGEWAYQALRRAANGDEPHERDSIFGQQIEIIHIARDGMDSWIEVYDWTMFLELNPQTWPGDRICDTIKPRLQLEMEPFPENIHKSTPTP